ncbi:unnamed protein product, partial [Mesorhabditis spiculigera]
MHTRYLVVFSLLLAGLVATLATVEKTSFRVDRNSFCNQLNPSRLNGADVYETILTTVKFAECGNPLGAYTMSMSIVAVDMNLRVQRVDRIWTRRKQTSLDPTTYVDNTSLPLDPMVYFAPASGCDRLYRLDKCFHANDGFDEYDSTAEVACFRRADALLFDFKYDGVDLVALQGVDVTIESVAKTADGEILANVTRTYQHSILLPCKMVFDRRAIYQIGPGYGRFKALKSYLYTGANADLVEHDRVYEDEL